VAKLTPAPSAPSVSRLRRDPPPPQAVEELGAKTAPPFTGELSAKPTEGASRLWAWLFVASLSLLLACCAPAPSPPRPPAPQPTVAERPAPDCRAPGFEAAARINQSSLAQLPWAPFGRDEVGWRIYAPLIAHEIGVDCPAVSPAFARGLADWQARRGYPPDGLVSGITFTRLKGELQGRRPFVLLSARGVCAAPATEGELVTLAPQEGLGGKVVQLQAGAARAWRAMVAAARAEDPAIAADPELMKVFSGYRSPAYDAARCQAQGNCNGRERATCSPHRTGQAMDLYLGTAPGFSADSSADANRLAMTKGAAYRWLLANAARFGFVNYPFEPWHWEWTGQPLETP